MMPRAEPGSGLPSLAEVLPHRPPLRVLDGFDACEGHEVVCSVVLRTGMPYVEPTGAPSILSLEIFAQTAATLFGYRAWLTGVPFEGGALVGVRDLRYAGPRLPIGVRLRARASERWTIDAMSHFDCVLSAGDAVLAEAQLTVAVGRLEEYVE